MTDDEQAVGATLVVADIASSPAVDPAGPGAADSVRSPSSGDPPVDAAPSS